MNATPITAPVARRRFFADLGVQPKILVAVGIAALVALAVGVVGLLSLSKASASAQLIYRSNVAITGVAESARTTSQGVAESQQATGEIARMSTDLATLVAGFRY